MCASNVRLRERFDKRTSKIYSTLHFSTRSLPFFNLYYQLFYVNKVKVVPSNIGILLSPVALGQWIMDDGSFKSGLTLQTNAFSVSDVELLISVLKSNFDIISLAPRVSDLNVINLLFISLCRRQRSGKSNR